VSSKSKSLSTASLPWVRALPCLRLFQPLLSFRVVHPTHCVAWVESTGTSQKDAERVADLIDVNNDGLLSTEELSHLIAVRESHLTVIVHFTSLSLLCMLLLT